VRPFIVFVVLGAVIIYWMYRDDKKKPAETKAGDLSKSQVFLIRVVFVGILLIVVYGSMQLGGGDPDLRIRR